MARAVFLVWVFSIMWVWADLANANLGINWGGMASHPLPPDRVVQMLKENDVKKVKIFDAELATMKVLSGSGIQVMVGIPNEKLDKLSSDYGAAQDWVKENATKYLHSGGVDIRYVAVGNEPFLSSYNGSFVKTLFPSMKNIQKALDEAGHGGKIKIVVPFNADVYDSPSGKPSEGKFRKDTQPQMVQILKFLQDHKAPFVVNIYPFLSLYQSSHFPVAFAFFDGKSPPVRDNNIEYKNVFDANYDTLVYALKKEGYPNMDITIGEVGWPTDGDKSANKTMAKKFYDGLLQKLAKGEGTPLRKNKDIEVYLFSLFDEDLKSVAPGDFERHWGIFRFDGQPKFPMDLSGKGPGTQMLHAVKGVQYLDQQWCVLNSDVKNLSSAITQLNFACGQADCTSLGFRRSCDLDDQGRVSYAFNAYFQNKDQDHQACDFNGMAVIVQQNPSKGDCWFWVQIQSAAGDRSRVAYAFTIFAGLFVMTFFTLIM